MAEFEVGDFTVTTEVNDTGPKVKIAAPTDGGIQALVFSLQLDQNAHRLRTSGHSLFMASRTPAELIAEQALINTQDPNSKQAMSGVGLVFDDEMFVFSVFNLESGRAVTRVGQIWRGEEQSFEGLNPVRSTKITHHGRHILFQTVMANGRNWLLVPHDIETYLAPSIDPERNAVLLAKNLSFPSNI